MRSPPPDASLSTPPNTRPAQAGVMGPYIVTVFFFLILLLITSYPSGAWNSGITKNYLSVHIVLELIGILVSFGIFTVGWSTYQNARDTDILILSVACFALGALDLGHTLSFTGMPDFVGPSGPNKAIDFWLASRTTGSFAFLFVALSKPREVRTANLQNILFTAALIWIVLCFVLILKYPEQLPIFFEPETGLRSIKVIAEWVLLLVSMTAGILLFWRAANRQNVNTRWMACACVMYGMTGYFFTVYRDFDDLYNFAGHCFKAASALVLYRAVFAECVSRPYERVATLAAEASAANLSKSRFLANVSHEFRTPLGVIGGFSDLLLSSGKLDTSLTNWAQTISRNSKQLSLLIDDLLDLAKAETEKIELQLTRFDLIALMSQVAQALEMQAGKKGVDLRFEPKPGAKLFVVSDELRLRQILMNLVGNAVKFTASGFVQIDHRVNENAIHEISVEDTGIGIEEKDVVGLFQPFSQVSNPNNRRFGGTGLGLSLSRKLAELLGGSLILKTSAAGKGSTFLFTFIDRVGDEAFKPALKTADLTVRTGPPAFHGKRVLIAEDSKDNQLLLRNYLNPTGIQISFANNGKEAVEQARGSRFDLILMDIQMPVMDGFEATQTLRQIGWNGQVLALTAHALQPERDRAMKNGFDDYLVKPINKELLWTAIGKSFGRTHTPLQSH